MGMYDSIKIKRTMPDGYQSDSFYQTKSLECELTEYAVDEDGQIYLIFERGKSILKPIALNFTGGIDFYNSPDKTYCALFDSGKLLLLKLLPQNRFESL